MRFIFSYVVSIRTCMYICRYPTTSITLAIDDGFSLTGRKDLFLTLRKKDLVIKFDHVIKSGGGKLVGMKMKPTNKSRSP